MPRSRLPIVLLAVLLGVAGAVLGLLLGGGRWTPFLMVVAMGGAVLAAAYPWQGFLVLLFLIPFQLDSRYVTDAVSGFSIAQMLAVVLFFVVVAGAVSGKLKATRSRTDLLVLAFVVVRILAGLLSDEPFGVLTSELVWFVTFVSLYFTATQLIQTPEQLKSAVRIVVFSWSVWAVVGLVQFILGPAWTAKMFAFKNIYILLWGGDPYDMVRTGGAGLILRRVVGNWEYVNFYAANVQYACFIALAGTTLAWRQMTARTRVLAVGLTALFAFNVLGTLSRGAAFAFAVALCAGAVVLSVRFRAARKYVLLGALGVSAIAAAAVAFLPAYLYSSAPLAARLRVSPIEERYYLWNVWLSEFFRRPWLGYGHEHTTVRGLANAHETYLEMTYMVGAVGTLIFLWLLLYVLVQSLKGFKQAEASFAQVMFLSGVASVVYFAIHGLTDYYLWVPFAGMTFWLFIGLWVKAYEPFSVRAAQPVERRAV